jgi:hypothetical protein
VGHDADILRRGVCAAKSAVQLTNVFLSEEEARLSC